MKTIKYFSILFILLSPIMIISLFIQLRLYALAICIFWYLIYLGLSIRDGENENEFIILEKGERYGDKSITKRNI